MFFSSKIYDKSGDMKFMMLILKSTQKWFCKSKDAKIYAKIW